MNAHEYTSRFKQNKISSSLLSSLGKKSASLPDFDTSAKSLKHATEYSGDTSSQKLEL